MKLLRIHDVLSTDSRPFLGRVETVDYSTEQILRTSLHHLQGEQYQQEADQDCLDGGHSTGIVILTQFVLFVLPVVN
jgi:hypothetical protein